MNKYILKDGQEVEAIPVGRAQIKIGEKQKNGRLTICNRGPDFISSSGTHKTKVICRCDCGNYTLITKEAFQRESTLSCGCYNKELHRDLCKQLGSKPKGGKDYSKIDNPFYEFCYPTNNKKDRAIIWKIKCKKCQAEYEAVPAEVVSETRRRGANPCTCWQNINKGFSKGVLKIKELLNNNNISYEEEKTFKTCISPKNAPLRFDFFLKDYNILIEYDGEQHYQPLTFGNKDMTAEDRLKYTQEYDKIKNMWCINNNINLIRIPYTHYENITINDLILTEDNPWLITKQTV